MRGHVCIWAQAATRSPGTTPAALLPPAIVFSQTHTPPTPLPAYLAWRHVVRKRDFGLEPAVRTTRKVGKLNAGRGSEVWRECEVGEVRATP